MATWQEVRVFISSTFRDMHASVCPTNPLQWGLVFLDEESRKFTKAQAAAVVLQWGLVFLDEESSAPSSRMSRKHRFNGASSF